MIHFVHVIHLDPERSAALGRAFVLVALGFLAWFFLPEWWNSGLSTVVLAPFAWLLRAAIGTLRFLVVVQVLLLPVWAYLAGGVLVRDEWQQGCTIWLGMVGLAVASIALLGHPVLAGTVALGGLAALWAVTAVQGPVEVTGWIAAVVAVGLSAWGAARFGTAMDPAPWLLVPASWACLALGGVRALRHEVVRLLRDGPAVRLLLFAALLAAAAAGPFAWAAVAGSRVHSIPGLRVAAEVSSATAAG